MPFPLRLLNEKEDLVLDRKPHWIFIIPGGLAVVGAFVLMVVLYAMVDVPIVRWTGVIIFLVALLFGVIRYFTWTTTNFVVTTDRVVYRAGIFAKRGMEIPLERVNNISANQSIIERMVGAGDLVIESGGEDGRSVFYDVVKPFEVANIIHAERENAAARDRRDTGRPITASAPVSVSDELTKLGTLMHQGLISQAEFDLQKQKLLNM
jgi:uncharacterized membrane protein YdbT with pleckstrin-like domain